MKTKLFIYFSFCFQLLFSQDIHFSQPFVDRLYLNPCLIGSITDHDYRVSIQRKSQWQSISIPFSTFSSSIEIKNFYKNFNLGVQFLNDKSGSSSLTLNQFNLGLSKKIILPNINQISFGGIIGVAQKTINYDHLLFEEQEILFTNSFYYADIGCGVSYKTNRYKTIVYDVGYSIYHLNTPNNSFINHEESNLPLKSNFLLRLNYNYRKNTMISSEIIITKQYNLKEILFGIKPNIELKEITISPIAYYRLNDAGIIGVGFEKNNFQANISYDINTSDLIAASNNRGGFEFSIIYLWNKKENKKSIKIIEPICPKYL